MGLKNAPVEKMKKRNNFSYITQNDNAIKTG